MTSAEYRAEGLIGPADPYVVAVNGARISPLVRGESDPPFIVGTVFPVGVEYVAIHRESREVVGGGYTYAVSYTHLTLPTN